MATASRPSRARAPARRASSASTEFVTAVEPDADKVLTLEWMEGSQAVLGEPGRRTAPSSTTATPRTTTCASARRSQIQVPSGNGSQLEIKGIFDPPAGGSPFGSVTFSSETFDREYDSPRNLYTFVLMQGGVTEANTRALDDSLADFPNAKAQTQRGVRRQPDQRR